MSVTEDKTAGCHLYEVPRTVKYIKTENRMWSPGPGQGGSKELCRVSVLQVTRFRNLLHVVRPVSSVVYTQQCKGRKFSVLCFHLSDTGDRTQVLMYASQGLYH